MISFHLANYLISYQENDVDCSKSAHNTVINKIRPDPSIERLLPNYIGKHQSDSRQNNTDQH